MSNLSDYEKPRPDPTTLLIQLLASAVSMFVRKHGGERDYVRFAHQGQYIGRYTLGEILDMADVELGKRQEPGR